jgi:hypothetical protein
VRLDEQAASCAVGAGERALGVSEELALEERLGDRAAVDRDERLVATRRLGVDGARQHLLAGSALAHDEHRRLEGRSALHHLEEVDHRGGGRDDRPVSHRALDVALQQCGAAAQALALVGLAKGEQGLGRLEGLRQVVVGAPLHCLDRELLGAVGRHHDEGAFGEPPREQRQELHSVHAGHSQVAQDDVEGSPVDGLERPLRVGCAVGFVALGGEHELEALAEPLVVVHDQDPIRHVGIHRTVRTPA